MKQLSRALIFLVLFSTSARSYATDMTGPCGMSGSNPRPRQTDEPVDVFTLPDFLSLLNFIVGF